MQSTYIIIYNLGTAAATAYTAILCPPWLLAPLPPSIAANFPLNILSRSLNLHPTPPVFILRHLAPSYKYCQSQHHIAPSHSTQPVDPFSHLRPAPLSLLALYHISTFSLDLLLLVDFSGIHLSRASLCWPGVFCAFHTCAATMRLSCR